MDTADYVSSLGVNAPALLAAAREADPSGVVEGCPEWSPIDLAWHIGEVHHFWGSIVAGRHLDPDGVAEPQRPATDDAVYELAEAAAARLIETLGATDPATEVWTWSADHDVAFVARRMAQETAVHRWDAEHVAGRTWEIAPDFAADGVDEFLEHFAPRATKDAPAIGGSVHLHCADTPGEWLVRESGDEGATYVVTREHAKGDAAIRGKANDLLLALWRRQPLDAVEVIGDAGVAARFVTRTDTE